MFLWEVILVVGDVVCNRNKRQLSHISKYHNGINRVALNVLGC